MGNRKANPSGNGVLHIVFSEGAAWSLRGALRRLGRNDRIACLFDDLSYGPIDPPDPQARHQWVVDQLGFTGWPETPEGVTPFAETEFGDVELEDVPATSRTFWTRALTPGPRRIVWASRRSATEYAGLLEWIWRAGDLPCDIVDLTAATSSRHPPACGPPKTRQAFHLASLWPDDIVADDWLGQAKALPPAARAHHRELWGRLRAENAAFRVIVDGELQSAPITAFDDLLLSKAKTRWRKIAMMVGLTICDQNDAGADHAPDMVLAARVKALITAGHLEFAGMDPFAISFAEVRLAKRSGAAPRSA
jgi:hypothetical protein